MLPPSPASAIHVPHPSLMLIPSTPRRRRRRCRLRPSHALSPSTLSSADSSSTQLDSFTKYSGYVFQSAGASPADNLIDYDPSKISSIYRRKPLLLVRRLFHIATTFGRWFALRYIDRLLDSSEQLFKVSRSTPAPTIFSFYYVIESAMRLKHFVIGCILRSEHQNFGEY